VPRNVIFPALGIVTAAGFLVGVLAGAWYWGTIAALAGWTALILFYRQRQLRRRRG
jgi:hypothetical protein